MTRPSFNLAARATLTTAPAQVDLRFSEDVDPRYITSDYVRVEPRRPGCA
jgi:methionine-rich copper-binding protein CopC